MSVLPLFSQLPFCIHCGILSRIGKCVDSCCTLPYKFHSLTVTYRRILDREDIDIVGIATPDHGHSQIAIEARLGRKLVWDAKTDTFVNDAHANTFFAREQRKGFEIPRV